MQWKRCCCCSRMGAHRTCLLIGFLPGFVTYCTRATPGRACFTLALMVTTQQPKLGIDWKYDNTSEMPEEAELGAGR